MFHEFTVLCCLSYMFNFCSEMSMSGATSTSKWTWKIAANNTDLFLLQSSDGSWFYVFRPTSHKEEDLNVFLSYVCVESVVNASMSNIIIWRFYGSDGSEAAITLATKSYLISNRTVRACEIYKFTE